MPDELPADSTMFYHKALYEPTSGEFYALYNSDAGTWRVPKIPAILLDGPPSFGAGKGSRYAPMRKLRAKR